MVALLLLVFVGSVTKSLCGTCDDAVQQCIRDAQAEYRSDRKDCEKKTGDDRLGCEAIKRQDYDRAVERCRKSVTEENSRGCCPKGQKVCCTAGSCNCCGDSPCMSCGERSGGSFGECRPCDPKKCEVCTDGKCKSTCNGCQDCIRGVCEVVCKTWKCEKCGLDVGADKMRCMSTCGKCEKCGNDDKCAKIPGCGKEKTYCPCNNPNQGKPKNYPSESACYVGCPTGIKCFGTRCTTPP